MKNNLLILLISIIIVPIELFSLPLLKATALKDIIHRLSVNKLPQFKQENLRDIFMLKTHTDLTDALIFTELRYPGCKNSIKYLKDHLYELDNNKNLLHADLLEAIDQDKINKNKSANVKNIISELKNIDDTYSKVIAIKFQFEEKDNNHNSTYQEYVKAILNNDFERMHMHFSMLQEKISDIKNAKATATKKLKAHFNTFQFPEEDTLLKESFKKYQFFEE